MTEATLSSIAVATDGSERAEKAVAFAARMAECFGADLTLIHVSPSGQEPESVASQAQRYRCNLKVVAGADPSDAIVQTITEIKADAIVLGNLGMSDRKEFLLGNVPNRVSHKANCTVVIVDTRDEKQRKRWRR